MRHVDVCGELGIGGREAAATALVAARVAAMAATSPGRDSTDRRILATFDRRARPAGDDNARLVSSRLFKNLILIIKPREVKGVSLIAKGNSVAILPGVCMIVKAYKGGGAGVIILEGLASPACLLAHGQDRMKKCATDTRPFRCSCV